MPPVRTDRRSMIWVKRDWRGKIYSPPYILALHLETSMHLVVDPNVRMQKLLTFGVATFLGSQWQKKRELLLAWTYRTAGLGLEWDESMLDQRLFWENLWKECHHALLSPKTSILSHCFKLGPKKIFIFEIPKLMSRSFSSFSISWLCTLIFPNKCPGLCQHFTNHKFLISEE